MKIFTRTENGTTTEITFKQYSDEINHAMMVGQREVREMSSGSMAGRTDIEYKDGRKVILVRKTVADAPKTNVVGLRGGKVHAKSAFTTPGKVYAQCRVSARTEYRETTAAITCDVCAENVRRGGTGM
jgi:hypothetical protein